MRDENKNVMEFSVQTPAGRVTVHYDYSDAIELFKIDFREYVISNEIGGKEYPNIESWQIAFGYAAETLIKIFPQVISDALDRAYFEARAKALKELNETPYFSEQKVIVGGKKISKINPMQILKNYNPKTLRKFCDEVADESYKRSRQRIGIITSGGKDSKLRVNYYAALENYYERHRPQAKFILDFYKWKREHLDSKSHSKMSDNKWHKYFLENLYKGFTADAETLRGKIANAQNRKEKKKYTNTYKALDNIRAFPNEDILRWRQTFHRILAEDFDPNINITLESLKPEDLTYYMLSGAFGTSQRTIKNNLKDLRREKKRLKKTG